MKNGNTNDIKSVLMLVSKLQNLCEGFDETNKSAVLTSKVRVLLEISHNSKATPSYIKTQVGLAKSNVAILCNKLQSEGLIEKHRDGFDTREICYSITPSGVEYLNKFLATTKKNFERQLAYKNNMEQISTQVDTLLDLIK